MTWLEISPQDVWLFRDGKPFSAGEDHSAHSMFPPTPLTVQGALRQKISMSLGVSLLQYKLASKGKSSTPQAEQAVVHIGKHGDMSDFGKFRMRGPFVGLRTNAHVVPLFPVPADLLIHTETETKSHEFRFSNPISSFKSDMGGHFAFPEVIKGFENLPGYWMTYDIFQNYLKGIVPTGEVFTNESTCKEAMTAYQHGKRIWHSQLVYQNDNRFGVSTNAMTSFREEGLLYQVQFVRPHSGIGLLAHVEDTIDSKLLAGPITIGGEQRQANISIVDHVEFPLNPKTTKGRFKVIFLTPAYFDDGWQPKNGDWSGLFGHEVSLKSAMLYRPMKIGGWNTAENRARPMHNYVAPGSVYYFETETSFELPDTLTQAPNNINIEAIGFGQYAITSW